MQGLSTLEKLKDFSKTIAEELLTSNSHQAGSSNTSNVTNVTNQKMEQVTSADDKKAKQHIAIGRSVTNVTNVTYKNNQSQETQEIEQAIDARFRDVAEELDRQHTNRRKDFKTENTNKSPYVYDMPTWITSKRLMSEQIENLKYLLRFYPSTVEGYSLHDVLSFAAPEDYLQLRDPALLRGYAVLLAEDGRVSILKGY